MEKQLTDKSLVPVAYQVRMSDGRWGTIFHHPDKPLGDHRPLYAHPPQPTDTQAHLEAYGRSKVQEGMQRAAEVARECWNDPPCKADAKYIPNAILADIEKSQT